MQQASHIGISSSILQQRCLLETAAQPCMTVVPDVQAHHRWHAGKVLHWQEVLMAALEQQSSAHLEGALLLLILALNLPQLPACDVQY